VSRKRDDAPALETEAGRRAWENALEAVGGDASGEVREPLERYARAADLAGMLREEWTKSGRPATSTGGATGKALVPHPLVKMMAEAEQEAAKLYEQLLRPAPAAGGVRRGPGRPIGSVSAPDRRPEPPMIRRAPRLHHEPELREVAG